MTISYHRFRNGWTLKWWQDITSTNNAPGLWHHMVLIGHNKLLAIGDFNCIIYISNASEEMFVSADVITHWKYNSDEILHGILFASYHTSQFYILLILFHKKLKEQRTLSHRAVHLMYGPNQRNISNLSNTFAMLMIWYGKMEKEKH